ncbi:28351_t:CDS:2 [Gigaspora margarita]|uniref:28351_t:CDS:1 n=1 Tax=Gigaspora margarita TaxID=4874 RepID=A0ABM8W3L2_GIGMA|nr:28351_t:CDS:2 [Gigaspora margarita]
MFKNGLVIKKAFESADLIIPTLLTTTPNYSQDKLTSKPLNFQSLFNSSYISPAQSSRIYGKEHSCHGQDTQPSLHLICIKLINLNKNNYRDSNSNQL